jgi:hypothetical protein
MEMSLGDTICTPHFIKFVLGITPCKRALLEKLAIP